MSTFTLVVLIWGSGSPALATVPNFTMESMCIKAGQDLQRWKEGIQYECVAVK